MLSRHPERCRYPHGHSRKIEVVLVADHLDENGMVVDFKALKLACEPIIDQFDHSTAINSRDPLLESIQSVYPNSLVVFDNAEPTTEAMAERLFMELAKVLEAGFEVSTASGAIYRIAPNQTRLEKVRVWETPTSWAEYQP